MPRRRSISRVLTPSTSRARHSTSRSVSNDTSRRARAPAGSWSTGVRGALITISPAATRRSARSSDSIP